MSDSEIIFSVEESPEGGYEARDAILMGSLPGPLAANTEETIFAAVRELMRAVGRAPQTR